MATETFHPSDPKPDRSDPPRRGAAVTPSDVADLTFTARCLYIGVAGNVKVDTADGDTLTFTGCTGSFVLPWAIRRVYATGTTATNLIAGW